MAKGDKLTQKDLLLWTMKHPNGTKTYYVIEKAPFEAEGLKKAIHLPGSSKDAVYLHRDQAEAAIALFPPGAAEAPAGGETAETADAESATEVVE